MGKTEMEWTRNIVHSSCMRDHCRPDRQWAVLGSCCPAVEAMMSAKPMLGCHWSRAESERCIRLSCLLQFDVWYTSGDCPSRWILITLSASFL